MSATAFQRHRREAHKPASSGAPSSPEDIAKMKKADVAELLAAVGEATDGTASEMKQRLSNALFLGDEA